VFHYFDDAVAVIALVAIARFVWSRWVAPEGVIAPSDALC